MSPPWLALVEAKRLRWGGDLRRYHLLRELIRITHARQVGHWDVAAVTEGLRDGGGARPRLASVELLEAEALDIARVGARLVAVDLHDEPVAHSIAMGYPLDSIGAAALRSTVAANLDAFRFVIVQSPEFARLANLAPAHTIIAPNGTDSDAIRPGPWPSAPVVALITGASPGRGIEETIAACRSLRPEWPGLRLILGIAGTGEESARYVTRVQATVAGDSWIEAGPIPYAEVGIALASARVVVIGNQASTYWDAILPIKLFDYLASGRPIVTTPRMATASVVERYRAGVVAGGDRPNDLATAIEHVLGDEALAHRMGAAGRLAAETVYDWRVIGRRLAEDLLRAEDRAFWLRRRVAVARGRAH